MVHTSPEVAYSLSLYGAWHSRVAYRLTCLLGLPGKQNVTFTLLKASSSAALPKESRNSVQIGFELTRINIK